MKGDGETEVGKGVATSVMAIMPGGLAGRLKNVFMEQALKARGPG